MPGSTLSVVVTGWNGPCALGMLGVSVRVGASVGVVVGSSVEVAIGGEVRVPVGAIVGVLGSVIEGVSLSDIGVVAGLEAEI